VSSASNVEKAWLTSSQRGQHYTAFILFSAFIGQIERINEKSTRQQQKSAEGRLSDRCISRVFLVYLLPDFNVVDFLF